MSDWKLTYPDDLAPDLPDLLKQVLETEYPNLDRPELDLRVLLVPDDVIVNGRLAPGKTVLSTTREHELQGIDAWLYVSWEWWQPATGEQREALFDHLLAHLFYDVEHETLSLVRPDVQEFSRVWERRGDWNERLEAARRNLQGTLPGLEAVAVPEGEQDAAVERLSNSPTILRSVRNLCPKPGEGIESVTISTAGQDPVVLTAETRKNIDRRIKAAKGA